MDVLAVGEVLWDLLPTGPRLGGAPLNFAIECCKLGLHAAIAGSVGQDDLGDQLRQRARRHGVDVSCLQIDPRHPTGTVDIEIDDQGLPTYSIARPVAYDFMAWNDLLANAVSRVRWICFGTLAQREETSRASLRRILEGSQAMKVLDLNLRVPMPAKEVVRSSLESCNWLKVNEEEMRFLKGWLGIKESDDAVTLERVRREFDIDLIALTLGPRGCHVQSDQGDAVIAGIPITLGDTVGAGDAFLAGLVAAVHKGASLHDAATSANSHAAHVLAGR